MRNCAYFQIEYKFEKCYCHYRIDNFIPFYEGGKITSFKRLAITSILSQVNF